ncbi:MAG TPA: M14 family metallopeptidase, partial [Blastocatellia bacterium]|nr:M14 family metallopeptidase [Blastocatellia bacterium]
MPANGQKQSLQSRAERTNYSETSRYADVIEFIAGLQRLSPMVKVETFGRTNEGRALPLVILSKPSINNPAEALASGKPVVFIMANIHAGEVEGKEASQHLMRDIATGPLASLLDKMVILVAPIYNADGNEKIDINNRTAQNGPLTGVGTRENAQRLDLNRDFIKLKSPEARGLVEGVFNRWDPHVIIDLHTTNGSFHGYALTYSPPLNPNTDRRIISFVREKLLPDVTRTLSSKYGYHAYFYGNFVDQKNPLRELGPEEKSDPKAWATFDNRPRFGTNYAGLRNRIAILSEAYSYLDFKARVDVSDKFVRAILQYVADHDGEVVSLVRDSDRYSIEKGTTQGNESGFGISFELAPSPKPVDILVGSVTQEIDPRTNKPRLKATGEARPVKMAEFGEFRPTSRIKPPAAYILKPGQKDIVRMLLAHGIAVEELQEEIS